METEIQARELLIPMLKRNELKKQAKVQIITHKDKNIFESWGFITEEKPFKQLKLIPDRK